MTHLTPQAVSADNGASLYELLRIEVEPFEAVAAVRLADPEARFDGRHGEKRALAVSPRLQYAQYGQCIVSSTWRGHRLKALATPGARSARSASDTLTKRQAEFGRLDVIQLTCPTDGHSTLTVDTHHDSPWANVIMSAEGSRKPQVVVVGGQFAGRRAAKLLRRGGDRCHARRREKLLEYTPGALRCLVEPRATRRLLQPHPPEPSMLRRLG